jgi:hypothetical protein
MDVSNPMPADGNSDVTLLAPNDAMVLGPDVDTWLDTLATDAASSGPPAAGSKTRSSMACTQCSSST